MALSRLSPPDLSCRTYTISFCVYHSILRDKWTAILGMVRSRRDAGLLKLVEVQLGVDENWHDWNPTEDIRALSGGDFEMRVEEWDPPSQDHLYLWHLS